MSLKQFENPRKASSPLFPVAFTGGATKNLGEVLQTDNTGKCNGLSVLLITVHLSFLFSFSF